MTHTIYEIIRWTTMRVFKTFDPITDISSDLSSPLVIYKKKTNVENLFWLIVFRLFQEINGTFKLVPQSPGRMPPHSTPAHRPQGQYLFHILQYNKYIYVFRSTEYCLTVFCLLDLTVVKTVHCSTDDDEEDIMIDDETTPSNHSGEWSVISHAVIRTT